MTKARQQRLAEGLARVVRILSTNNDERYPLIDTPIVRMKPAKPVVNTGKAVPKWQGIGIALSAMRRSLKQ